MSYRSALASVPQKPVIAACLVVTALVAIWYGWSRYEVCRERGELSAALRDWARSTLDGHTRPLEAAAPFVWDEVRIAEGVAETEIAPLACPFGGHWGKDERASLARAGGLTLFGFFAGGRLVALGDFRRDWASFEGVEGALAREAAVFEAADGQTLRPVAQ
ncbi:hypothetical protein [Lutibaculum baratangense]|uniref:Uncharacterized protein n=1 Tax=Lutibaculum baratangense AMV1 TaxID=631454 RepID=V4TI37_9HYPH|nr:hypothetical protein [Lutibaculum baratangense]ESR25673.1 hypothetical protein N177_1506 [Lutibaculum baratangense AMV1]